MLPAEMTLITGLSLIGAAIGYGGWWILQRWRPATTHSEAEQQGESGPPLTADPGDLRDDPLLLGETAVPAAHDLSDDLEEIRTQLREIAKAQLSLLESERDRPERVQPDPRVELILAETRLHSETMAATATSIGEQLKELRDDIRVRLDEAVAASARTDPRIVDVISELSNLKTILNDSAMSATSGDLFSHLALVGEDVARVLAAVSDTARVDAIGQDVARRIDQILERIPDPAVGKRADYPGSEPALRHSEASKVQSIDSAAPQPRGLAYIPPQNSGVVTVLNRRQQDPI